MSIIFDYPLLIEHKYTAPKTKALAYEQAFYDGCIDVSTVENILVYKLRAISIVELPIYLIKINQIYSEVILCLVILQ